MPPPISNHLDEQLRSARRLLESVLDQGTAARARDAEAVLAATQEIQLEMERRATLEAERATLLGAAATQLGCTPGEVTVERLASTLAPGEADDLRIRGGELRGLLDEIRRAHAVARALVRQELAFLDHLLRRLGEPAEDRRLVDVQA